VLSGLKAEAVEPTLILWSLWQELRMIWVTLVPGPPVPPIWTRNRAAMPVAAARFKSLGRAQFLRLNTRLAEIDRIAKGRRHGNVWDELSLLVAEFASGTPVLRAVA
jgi:DNA polymerase III delta subunit